MLPPRGLLPLLRWEAFHAPQAERQMRDRQDRCFMSPVFVCDAIPVDPRIDFLPLVAAEATPERQVVRAVEHVDAVELQSARFFEVSQEVLPSERSFASRQGKTLSMKPKPDDRIFADTH